MIESLSVLVVDLLRSEAPCLSCRALLPRF